MAGVGSAVMIRRWFNDERWLSWKRRALGRAGQQVAEGGRGGRMAITQSQAPPAGGNGIRRPAAAAAAVVDAPVDTTLSLSSLSAERGIAHMRRLCSQLFRFL